MSENAIKILWVVLGVLGIIYIYYSLVAIKSGKLPQKKDLTESELMDIANEVFSDMSDKHKGYYISPSIDTIKGNYIISEKYYKKDVCDIVLYRFEVPLFVNRVDLNIKYLNDLKKILIKEMCGVNGSSIQEGLYTSQELQSRVVFFNTEKSLKDFKNKVFKVK